MRNSCIYVACVMTLSLAACSDDQPVKVSPSLDAPSNLRAVERTSASITLAWLGPSDATRFELQRRSHGEPAFSALAQLPLESGGGSYADSSLAPRSTHTYRVRATNDVATSAWSDSLTVRTGLAAPVLESVTSPNAVTAELHWQYEPVEGTIEIQRRRSISWEHAASVPAAQHAYSDSSQAPFAILSYRVRAIEEADRDRTQRRPTYYRSP